MHQATQSIVDRSGKPVAVGAKIRVQQCIGRYGQTQIVEGTISQLTEFNGAVLTLDKPARQRRHDHWVTLEPGKLFFVSLPGEFDGDRYVCARKFEDFEHGHETWVDVIQ